MFEYFIKKGDVRRASPDKSLVKSLIEGAEKDIKFFNNLKIDENSARKLMVNYYDILGGILEAIASIDGYKIYLHEAFTFYLKEIKNEEVISIKLDRFRRIRNLINYYGKDISIEETKENIGEIKKIISDLMNKYLREYDG